LILRQAQDELRRQALARLLYPTRTKRKKGRIMSNIKAQGSNPKIKVKAQVEVKVKETEFLTLA
jgi:hypothetical protein